MTAIPEGALQNFRFNQAGDVTVLLDLRDGQYYGLSPEAAFLLGSADVGNSDATQYDLEIARRELEALAMREGVTQRRHPPLGRMGDPSVLRAFRNLRFVKRAAEGGRLIDLYCSLARRDICVPVQRSTRPRHAGSDLAKFRAAENFVILPRAPSDCLPRSLALFLYLRSSGHEAIHKLGVTSKPGINMHAWVELDGRAVLNDTSIDTYSVINAI